MVLANGSVNGTKTPSATNGSSVDSTFAKAGLKTGLEIWRIEKQSLIAVEPAEHGKLYFGDVYIVLNTPSNSNTPKQLHFWIGLSSSQESVSFASTKIAELDEHFHGATVQFREMQGHESATFMSYFKDGIRYLQGGTPTVQKQSDRAKAAQKRLFHIKGKRNIRICQVEVAASSLNQANVFVLDTVAHLYVWIGPQSSQAEQRKGIDIARRIRDTERAGRAFIHIIDDEWSTSEEFFKELHSQPNSYVKAEHDADDTQHERNLEAQTRLYRITEASNNRTEIKELAQGQLKRSALVSEDCCILDFETSQIFLWLGQRCSSVDKKTIWKRATDYLKQRSAPKWTPVVLLHEGHEPAAFKQAFADWSVAEMQLKAITNGIPRLVRKGKDLMPDEGDGDVQVWRVENFYHRPLDKRDYGSFYSGDTYVILYKYFEQKKLEKSIVYLWLGLKSCPEEQASAAVIATNIDSKEAKGEAIQIRVNQNREPAHFLSIFRGRMVVLMGGFKSGFKSVNGKDSYAQDGIRLFQVREERIIQVPEKASSLSTRDVFVLETPKATFIWHGKAASEEERQFSKEFAKRVIPLKNPVIVKETQEPPEFWAALGGKGKYAADDHSEDAYASFAARLMHCSYSGTKFHAEEVTNFTQDDLIEDDVLLLDTFDEIFIWVGRNVSETDRKESMRLAMDYVRTDPYDRVAAKLTLLIVKQGFEPAAFIGHFPSWNAEKWNQLKTLDDLKHDIFADNVKAFETVEAMKIYEMTYPIEVLRQKDLPEGVNPAHKEQHLNDEDFLALFGLLKEEWEDIPQWKKLDLKKKANLF